MRSRKSLLTLGLICLAGFSLAIVGCSSDERPTIPEPPDQPDPTISDEYGFVIDEVNQSVEQTIALMSLGLEVFDLASLTNDSAIIAEIKQSPLGFDTVSASDDWYVMTTVGGIATSVGTYARDSVRFTANGVTQKFSGAADGMQVRHYWEQVSGQTKEAYADYTQRARLIFSGMNTEQAYVSGWVTTNGVIQEVGELENTVRTFTVEADMNSLVVDKTVDGWQGGCPASGTVEASVTLSTQVGSAPAENTVWDVTLTFTDGSVTAAVSDGTADATYSNSFCVPQ